MKRYPRPFVRISSAAGTEKQWKWLCERETTEDKKGGGQHENNSDNETRPHNPRLALEFRTLRVADDERTFPIAAVPEHQT